MFVRIPFSTCYQLLNEVNYNVKQTKKAKNEKKKHKQKRRMKINQKGQTSPEILCTSALKISNVANVFTKLNLSRII